MDRPASPSTIPLPPSQPAELEENLEEIIDKVPESHDINEPLINPMFPSLAPLGLSSQSYRRDGTSLRPVFNTNIKWEPYSPVYHKGIVPAHVEHPAKTLPTYFWFTHPKRPTVMSGPPQGRPSGQCQELIQHPHPTHPGHGTYMDSPVSPRSRNEPVPFHNGPPKPDHILPTTEPEDQNTIHDSDFSSTTSLSIPPSIAHEIRTICLLATQRYLRTNSPRRNNHRPAGPDTPPTPRNSPYPDQAPLLGIGYRTGLNLLLSKLRTPPLPGTPILDPTHRPQAPRSATASSSSNTTLNHDHSPTGTHSEKSQSTGPPSLLTSTAKICSLLWQRACAQHSKGSARVVVNLKSEKRAAAQMRMLLGWAETVEVFEGDGVEVEVGDERDGEDMPEGSEVLEAAEGFCEFLGDVDGVRRIGELVW
ncbi:hypothetical protein B0T16DRAFT_452796 [Cercophora newfieldiana]|uniref:Uncharacterized protein n=1 Tax=Cercophora newfieldiana TaxID=92897 RepID=A0AA40CZL4_9PEZI|nr:hypothetical protein B0T16DRAFT_452796 [Cercophora newfieldiana]